MSLTLPPTNRSVYIDISKLSRYPTTETQVHVSQPYIFPGTYLTNSTSLEIQTNGVQSYPGIVASDPFEPAVPNNVLLPVTTEIQRLAVAPDGVRTEPLPEELKQFYDSERFGPPKQPEDIVEDYDGVEDDSGSYASGLLEGDVQEAGTKVDSEKIATIRARKKLAAFAKAIGNDYQMAFERRRDFIGKPSAWQEMSKFEEHMEEKYAAEIDSRQYNPTQYYEVGTIASLADNFKYLTTTTLPDESVVLNTSMLLIKAALAFHETTPVDNPRMIDAKRVSDEWISRYKSGHKKLLDEIDSMEETEINSITLDAVKAAAAVAWEALTQPVKTADERRNIERYLHRAINFASKEGLFENNIINPVNAIIAKHELEPTPIRPRREGRTELQQEFIISEELLKDRQTYEEATRHPQWVAADKAWETQKIFFDMPDRIYPEKTVLPYVDSIEFFANGRYETAYKHPAFGWYYYDNVNGYNWAESFNDYFENYSSIRPESERDTVFNDLTPSERGDDEFSIGTPSDEQKERHLAEVNAIRKFMGLDKKRERQLKIAQKKFSRPKVGQRDLLEVFKAFLPLFFTNPKITPAAAKIMSEPTFVQRGVLNAVYARLNTMLLRFPDKKFGKRDLRDFMSRIELIENKHEAFGSKEDMSSHSAHAEDIVNDLYNMAAPDIDDIKN